MCLLTRQLNLIWERSMQVLAVIGTVLIPVVAATTPGDQWLAVRKQRMRHHVLREFHCGLVCRRHRTAC